jgi:serine protease inhibitor ecotin
MKKLMPTILVAAALLAFGGAISTRASDAAVSRRADKEKIENANRDAYDQARQIASLPEQDDDRLQETLVNLAQALDSGSAQEANPFGGGFDGATLEGRGFDNRSGRRVSARPRALVIRSTDTDSAAQGNLEEDLAVMLRILDKAIEPIGGSRTARTAMGINVSFVAGSSSVRSLYLDGHGALFMLNVGIPLIAPPKGNEEAKEKPAADSSWE